MPVGYLNGLIDRRFVVPIDGMIGIEYDPPQGPGWPGRGHQGYLKGMGFVAGEQLT